MSDSYLDQVMEKLNDDLSASIPPEDLFKIKVALAFVGCYAVKDQRIVMECMDYLEYAKEVDEY